MSKLTTFDLNPLYRHTIGVDRLLDRVLNSIEHQTTSQGYPPYNIIKKSENHYEIQIAVAGFSEGEISITVENGNLIVTGERKPSEEPVDYIHQGISSRKFIRTFSLAEYVEVWDAHVSNGILSIQLEHIVPDSLKPRAIQITYNN